MQGRRFDSVRQTKVCRTLRDMIKQTRKLGIWNPQIVKRAIIDSFIKLNPRKMMANPVMFVVEAGSLLTTVQLVHDIVKPTLGVVHVGFELQITLWLWF